MKTIKLLQYIFLSSVFCNLFIHTDVYAQQSNFQIAPSPIAYPYFEDGRMDGNLGGSFVSIGTDDMSLAGIAGDFKGRMAFSEFMAMDCDLGMTGMGGSMPGIPPITPIYASNGLPYGIQVAGDASLAYFSFRMTANLEIQPIRTDFGSLILFAGPNINISQFKITTPFNLIVPFGYSNTGEVFTGYTDTLAISTTLSGWQFGIQIDLDLGSGMRLSPFFMYSSFSGSATLTDTPDAGGAGSTSFSVDIPSSTSTSFGMDIIFDDISIGTVLQQLTSSEETNQDTRIIMISAGYHFSDGGSGTADESEAGTNSENEKKKDLSW